ncbi:aldolase [Reyranella sp. CPCC 100927]|uniref:aldolase n=1 Tax=Reyranella sp. CPCC 100927 TaxID=2599616 RepID=UPI0011B42C42|nr:aldolase [Reyranella sp. CPCC 100927]TWS96561.1 aldolase [Reyranella sp. CPCC 100927]
MLAAAKAEQHDEIDREMDDRLAITRWSPEETLALGSRILADEGHWRGGLAGQITARAGANRFLTLGFGVGFDEAKPDSLVLVDDHLKPVGNRGDMPNPGVRFHIRVYRDRPGVGCIVHTHPPAVAALSMVGEALAVAHMDATPFFDDCAYLADWPGLPIADREGEIISDALGPKHAIVLAHHGLLTIGATIEDAVMRAVWLEHAADMQLRARAIGPIKPIRPELAAESRDFLTKRKVIDLTFAYFARRALRRDPDCLAPTHRPRP